MRTDIETAVREIIGRVSRADVSSLRRDDDLVEHLGVDSLEGLQILAGVEKRFDVRLPDEELITMRTIGRIEEAVAKLRTSNFELQTGSAVSHVGSSKFEV
jgi:acyl carrier protein